MGTARRRVGTGASGNGPKREWAPVHLRLAHHEESCVCSRRTAMTHKDPRRNIPRGVVLNSMRACSLKLTGMHRHKTMRPSPAADGCIGTASMKPCLSVSKFTKSIHMDACADLVRHPTCAQGVSETRAYEKHGHTHKHTNKHTHTHNHTHKHTHKHTHTHTGTHARMHTRTHTHAPCTRVALVGTYGRKRGASGTHRCQKKGRAWAR